MIVLEREEQLKEDFSKGNVILVFSADWCGDCRFMEPFLPEIENKFADFTFVKVDRDQFMEVCQAYDIFGIPSFIALRDGEVVDSFISKDRKTQEEIERFLNNVKEKIHQK
jgi:thiol-disulfide isomerase/thioredoxin